MTEKQFVYMDLLETEAISVSDDECYYFNEYGTVQKICELLNELHEENQQCENEIARLQLINNKLKDKDYTNYKKKIQELQEENKELKAKVDDKEVAVEVETCKIMEKVFALIDKSLEKDKQYYEMSYEDYLNGRIEALEELKKELQK